MLGVRGGDKHVLAILYRGGGENNSEYSWEVARGRSAGGGGSRGGGGGGNHHGALTGTYSHPMARVVAILSLAEENTPV